MTMLFSSATQRLIAMTADSAVTVDFKDHREYATGQKSYRYPGIGCVTTWGGRDGNQIGPFLQNRSLSPSSHSIIELADLVEEYLTQEFCPRDCELGDVGYHVGGFDRAGRPRLFHVFWGCDRPNPSGAPPKYAKCDHSPKNGISLLYNGRNDLADLVIRKLMREIAAGADLRLDLRRPQDQTRLGDFVARFAAELTPEVEPPFITAIIAPGNSLSYVKNEVVAPVSDEELNRAFGRFRVNRV